MERLRIPQMSDFLMFCSATAICLDARRAIEWKLGVMCAMLTIVMGPGLAMRA
jgi:hypothetical protein